MCLTPQSLLTQSAPADVSDSTESAVAVAGLQVESLQKLCWQLLDQRMEALVCFSLACCRWTEAADDIFLGV